MARRRRRKWSRPTRFNFLARWSFVAGCSRYPHRHGARGRGVLASAAVMAKRAKDRRALQLSRGHREVQ